VVRPVEIIGLIHSFFLSVAGFDQNAFGAGAVRGFDVSKPVADHVRAAQVEIEVGGRLDKEPRLRLAAVAYDAIGVQAFGMMGAEVKPVEYGAFFEHGGLNLRVDLPDEVLGEEPLGHARLVGDDDRFAAAGIDETDGFIRFLEDHQLVLAVEVADFFIDGSVAVQEDGGIFCHARSTSFQQGLGRRHDVLDGDERHAAEVRGTGFLQAGAAWNFPAHQDGSFARGRRGGRIGGAENGDGGNVERARDMHESRVVAEKEPALGNEMDRLFERRNAREVDHVGCGVTADLVGGFPVGLAAEENRPGAKLRGQTISCGGKPVGKPALGRTIGGAGSDA